jgi:hypothetical protein
MSPLSLIDCWLATGRPRYSTSFLGQPRPPNRYRLRSEDDKCVGSGTPLRTAHHQEQKGWCLVGSDIFMLIDQDGKFEESYGAEMRNVVLLSWRRTVLRNFRERCMVIMLGNWRGRFKGGSVVGHVG